MDEEKTEERADAQPEIQITREHIALWLCGRLHMVLESMTNLAGAVTDTGTLSQLMNYCYDQVAELSRDDITDPRVHRAQIGAYWCSIGLLLLLLDSGIVEQTTVETDEGAPSEAAGCGEMPQE